MNKIKKLFVPKKMPSDVLSPNEYEVELRPFDDDTDEVNFSQSKMISYELRFPYVKGSFMMNLFSMTPEIYTLNVEFPELFYVNHFIEKFALRITFVNEENVKRTKFCTFSFIGPEARETLDSIRKTFCRAFVCKEFGKNTTMLVSFTLTETFVTLCRQFKTIEGIDIREVLEKKKFHQQYNLGQMLKNETEYRDFSIIVGFSEFKVHKCILATQSVVFAQMLAADMIESRNSTLKISDMNEDAVKAAIEFMYTGEISITPGEIVISPGEMIVTTSEKYGEVLSGLYVFAQKYNMTNLKWAVMSKCYDSAVYLRNRPEEKRMLIQTVTLHEPNMNDLDIFLAILGPYMVPNE